MVAPKFGIDLLGLNHKKVNARMVAKQWPSGVGLGVLLDTFTAKVGDWKNTETVLATGKVPYLRVHLCNTTALRSKTCPHDIFHGAKSIQRAEEYVNGKHLDLVTYFQRCDEWLEKVRREYNIHVEVSPFLEHNFSQKTMRALHRWFPFDINNPMKGIQRGPWQKNETHNERVPKGSSIHSLDGTDAISVRWRRFQIAAERNRTGTAFLWTHKFNLRSPKWKKFVCPVERDYTFDRDFFESMCAMLLAEPDTKALQVPGFRLKNLGRKYLWKTHDDEAYKPVAILPTKTRKGLDVVTFDGRKVGHLAYAGSWKDDKSLHRYYSSRGGSNDHGFELSEKAKKASGSPTIFLLDTEKKEGWRIPHGAQRWGFEYGKRKA